MCPYGFGGTISRLRDVMYSTTCSMLSMDVITRPHAGSLGCASFGWWWTYRYCCTDADCLMRSPIQVAESSNLRGVSPGSRKRFRGEWRQDRLAEQRSLLAKSGAQFKNAVDPAVEGARDRAVALADHYPVRQQALQKWRELVAVVLRRRGQMTAKYMAVVPKPQRRFVRTRCPPGDVTCG